MIPVDRSAGSIETLPVVPNKTPVIVVESFHIESPVMVTFEDELEKSKVPEAVVIDAPPLAPGVDVHPPSRIVLLALV
jgi:hypothetical protein